MALKVEDVKGVCVWSGIEVTVELSEGRGQTDSKGVDTKTE